MDPNAQVPPPPPPPGPEGWVAPPGSTAPVGWAVPSQPKAARSPIVKILLAVGVVVVIAGAGIAFRALTDGPAKIVFTTTEPPADFKC